MPVINQRFPKCLAALIMINTLSGCATECNILSPSSSSFACDLAILTGAAIALSPPYILAKAAERQIDEAAERKKVRKVEAGHLEESEWCLLACGGLLQFDVEHRVRLKRIAAERVIAAYPIPSDGRHQVLLMKAHQVLSRGLSGDAKREQLNEIIRIGQSYDLWEQLHSGRSWGEPDKKPVNDGKPGWWLTREEFRRIVDDTVVRHLVLDHARRVAASPQADLSVTCNFEPYQTLLLHIVDFETPHGGIEYYTDRLCSDAKISIED